VALEHLDYLVQDTLAQGHLLGGIVPGALGRLQRELLVGGGGISAQLGLEGQQAGDLLIDLQWTSGDTLYKGATMMVMLRC